MPGATSLTAPGTPHTIPAPNITHGLPRANSSAMLSLAFTTTALAILLATTPALHHWFVIPCYVSGVLIGADAVDWLRGRLDTFDPIGIVGGLGWHHFFLAPLLHVRWEYWVEYVTGPPEWRDWLGRMAVLNLAGILVYRRTRRWKGRGQRPRLTIWQIDLRRFFPLAVIALVTSLALQLVVYLQYGGISGYLAAAEERAFSGAGILFTLSESFPLVALLVFVVYARATGRGRSWPVLAVVLGTVFLLLLAFGGLRSNRSTVIWPLFMALAVIHLWIRPVSRAVIALGVAFLLLFSYLYGFYKGAGTEVLEVARFSASFEELERETGRTFETLVLDDLARSDIQAFLLYRLSLDDRDYDLAWGRTYIGAAALLIPRQLWPDRPPAKVREGTNLMMGDGQYESGRRSSRVYGLAGETMLNFPLVVVPAAFTLLGICVAAVRRFLFSLRRGDARRLVAPLLVIFSFALLINDSEILLFFLIKYGLVPFFLVTISAIRTPVPPKPIATATAR